MKIYYLSSVTFPSKAANAVHIMKMCQSLGKLGHDVTLFAYVKPQLQEELFQFYDIEPSFKIKLFKRINFPYFERWMGFIFGYYSFKNNVDFVIGRNINACYFSSLLGVKTYFESHAPMKYSGKVSDFLFRKMIRKTSFQKFVGITKSLEIDCLEIYPSLTEKMLTLPDGADRIDNRRIKSVGIKRNDKFNLGYTGHLYNGKGIELILQLSKLLDDTFFFHIVGGKSADIHYWKEKFQNSNVKFYGYVSHQEVKNYINEFDVVLLPNQRSVQSFAGVNIGKWTSPLKLFEYMSQGKPIVASKLPVLQEILRNNENAILCEADNAFEWKEAIFQLKNNPILADQIGRTAKNEFEEKFTWSNRAFQIVKDFERRKKNVHRNYPERRQEVI